MSFRGGIKHARSLRAHWRSRCEFRDDGTPRLMTARADRRSMRSWRWYLRRARGTGRLLNPSVRLREDCAAGRYPWPRTKDDADGSSR